MNPEHFKLFEYVTPGYLPLWVVHTLPGWHLKPQLHDHDFTEISFILSGRADHLSENACQSVSVGDVLLLHPGDTHTYSNAMSMELINIIFDRRKLPLFLLDAYALPLIRLIFPSTLPVRNHLQPILHLDSMELKTMTLAGLKLQGALHCIKPGHECDSLLQFLELILCLARLRDVRTQEQQSYSRLEETLSYINKNFRNSLTVADLTAHAHMSERSFFRHFKTVTGCNPNDYLCQLRLKYAAEQLLFSDKSITEIAIEAGFYDSSDFCRKFKKRYNHSPRGFRIHAGHSKSE